MENTDIISVYADINCPFCFALHERLDDLGLLSAVEWKTIEHAPNKDDAPDSPKRTSQLEVEYQLVIQRAKDTKIINPLFVPNTKLANSYIKAVQDYFPEKLIAVRKSVYRALWQIGANIDDKSVLDRIMAAHDIPLPLDFTGEQELKTWQREWQYGDFDLRIPSMQNSKHQVMLGLQHGNTIKRFIQGLGASSEGLKATCKYLNAYKLFVFSLQDLPSEFDVFRDTDDYLVETYKEHANIVEQIISASPDLILIDDNHHGGKMLCQAIRTMQAQIKHLPIVFYSYDKKRQNEAEVLSMGATDYLCLAFQADSLRIRIKNHIKVKHQIDVLSAYAIKDGLTGLNNKRALYTYLEKEWRNACRYQSTIALLFIDIDYFKEYNDTYGHPKGDEILVKVAEVLRSSVYRTEDFVARYGGEEFVIILPQCTPEAVNKVTNRIHASIARLNVFHQQSHVEDRLTVSIGTCMTHAHADNHVEMLIEKADEALYIAKQSGRDNTISCQLEVPTYQN